MIKCGMSEIVITPPLGLPIPGYFKPRPAEDMIDELYAKALVIDDGQCIIAIIALDMIGIEHEDVKHIRDHVFAATGIPPARIMIAATHTHTGGPVYRDQKADKDAYAAIYVPKAADAAITAYLNRKPAQIGLGRGSEGELSFNRRYFMKDGSVRMNPGFDNPDIVSPTGPIDPEVIVLRIDDEQGKPIGVVTNYANHPDVVGGKRYCADYPGELSRALKTMLGEQTISLFLNGACGNINHLDFLTGTKPREDHFRFIGRVLAGEVLKVREKSIVQTQLEVAGVSTVLYADVRKPSLEEIDKAKDLLRTAKDHPETKISDADLHFARHLIMLVERNESQAEVEVQVIRIGDLAIAAFPSELFVEFGLDIKKRSPFPYPVIAAYANGVNGYVATREAFDQGGYEIRLSVRTRLAPDTGYQMVSEALRLMEQIKTDERRV